MNIYLTKLINLKEKISAETQAERAFGVTEDVHARALSAMSLSSKARELYGYIARDRMIGLVSDRGFKREGQETKEIPLNSGKSILLYPESYSSFILDSILTKFINGSMMYLGDPGTGKTSMAMMMGMATGRPYNQLKKEVVHGQPQLSISDLFGHMDLAEYQKGVIRAIFHERITNQEADLIIDEINRIPTKTQSAILSLLAEKYVEFFGEVRDVNDRAVFATMNDKNGGGTYDLIDALRDRFNIAVMAYPRNYMYTGINTPDNTEKFPEKHSFSPEELRAARKEIKEVQLSRDAQSRLTYFLSLLNTAENAAFSAEHGYKANVSGSSVKSSAVFNSSGHDDPKKTISALIEGTVSDRFLRSVLDYAKALAWFRGKQQVDTEDIAAVVIPASMHRFTPSPHFEKIDPKYKYDTGERSRYLWQQAMEKYDLRFPDRQETVSKINNVPKYFMDDENDSDYKKATVFDNYWDLRNEVEGLSSTNQILATIYKSMQEFAKVNLEGSEGLEELLAMKLLFYHYYDPVLADTEKKNININETSKKNVSQGVTGISNPVPEKVIVKPIIEISANNISLTDSTGMQYVILPGSYNINLGSPGISSNQPHKVSLSAFLMSQTVVTQNMYMQVIKKNPSNFTMQNSTIQQAGITDTGSHPVEQVSWSEAIEYCKTLSILAKDIDNSIKLAITDLNPKEYLNYVLAHPEAHLFRLPTEAEWEYGALGEDDIPWSMKNSGNRTHDVNEGIANKLGLQMRGNIAQWCADLWDGDSGKETRVIKGGSWMNEHAEDFRAAVRARLTPESRQSNLGFRVVRT